MLLSFFFLAFLSLSASEIQVAQWSGDLESRQPWVWIVLLRVRTQSGAAVMDRPRKIKCDKAFRNAGRPWISGLPRRKAHGVLLFCSLNCLFLLHSQSRHQHCWDMAQVSVVFLIIWVILKLPLIQMHSQVENQLFWMLCTFWLPSLFSSLSPSFQITEKSPPYPIRHSFSINFLPQFQLLPSLELLQSRVFYVFRSFFYLIYFFKIYLGSLQLLY